MDFAPLPISGFSMIPDLYLKLVISNTRTSLDKKVMLSVKARGNTEARISRYTKSNDSDVLMNVSKYLKY